MRHGNLYSLAGCVKPLWFLSQLAQTESATIECLDLTYCSLSFEQIPNLLALLTHFTALKWLCLTEGFLAVLSAQQMSDLFSSQPYFVEILEAREDGFLMYAVSEGLLPPSRLAAFMLGLDKANSVLTHNDALRFLKILKLKLGLYHLNHRLIFVESDEDEKIIKQRAKQEAKKLVEQYEARLPTDKFYALILAEIYREGIQLQGAFLLKRAPEYGRNNQCYLLSPKPEKELKMYKILLHDKWLPQPFFDVLSQRLKHFISPPSGVASNLTFFNPPEKPQKDNLATRIVHFIADIFPKLSA